MKKSELTQLTQIIECIVAKEIRKQLPGIISETFRNMMGTPIVETKKQPEQLQTVAQIPKKQEVDENVSFKTLIRKSFENPSVPVIAPQEKKQYKTYVKDPVLNQILNETKSDLKERERMAGSGIAYAGQYGMAQNMFSPIGQDVMATDEIHNTSTSPIGNNTQTHPVIENANTDLHVPMESLAGVSVLDVASQVAPELQNVLTRDYSALVKKFDERRKAKGLS